MRLNAVSPYDFRLTTSVYTRFATQVVDYYFDGKYRRVLSDGTQLYLIEVESAGNVDEPSFEIRSLQPETFNVSDSIANDIRWILGLDYDLKPFYELMDQESETRRLKNSLYGLKPPRSLTIFEALVIAITEQQVSLAAAMTVRERLARRYGRKVLHDGYGYLEFPSPECLASASVEDIQALGLNSRKANTIKIVAELVASGTLALESLCELSIEQILTEMTKIKGIGPWTVEYMLCRGAGRYDAIPVNDIALKSGMKKWYGSERIKSEHDVRRILARYGQYSGYAAFYFIFSYAYEKYPPRLF